MLRWYVGIGRRREVRQLFAAIHLLRGGHTTDVSAIEGQYNGINRDILRCDLGPDNKCKRTEIKYPFHYEPLFPRDV